MPDLTPKRPDGERCGALPLFSLPGPCRGVLTHSSGRLRLAWNGSWNGPPDNPSPAGVSRAISYFGVLVRNLAYSKLVGIWSPGLGRALLAGDVRDGADIRIGYSGGELSVS